MPKNYTVKEVADILGFSTNSIYTFLKEKRLRGVRIGKGRFRIPETELARVLHLSKRQGSAPSESLGQFNTSQAGSSVIVSSPTRSGVRLGDILAPNIFDWFIGLAAVVAGFALFLFNSNFGSEDIAKDPIVLPLVRIFLIACGTGIIATSMHFEGRGWHKVFHVSLAVMGFLNAFGLIRSGDVEGALLYGLLGLVIVVSEYLRWEGTVTIILYATLLAFLFPLTVLFLPANSHVLGIGSALGLSSTSAGLAGLVGAVVLVTGIWTGFLKNRTVYIVFAWGIAVCDVLVAIWYGHLQYWSRAFFLVVTGYFMGLLPFWRPMQQGIARRYKYMLHGIFLGVGGVLFVAILMISLLQQNIWQAREQELRAKLHVAQSRIESAVTSARGSLTVAASNADFVSVIANKDIEKLNMYAKIIHESNPNIRRLVFLDSEGNGLALYPYGTFDDPNYAYRDYFAKAKSTGKPVISDVFQARADQSGRFVVVVSVPLVESNGTFRGVVAASLDLERMELLLNQIAESERGEHFVVADAKGVILEHSNATLIGTTAPPGDPLYLGIAGKEGIEQGVMIEKARGMISYTGVPSLRWGLSLRVPSRSVFELTSFAIWAVFGVMGAILVAGIGMFCLVRRRISEMQGGSGG